MSWIFYTVLIVLGLLSLHFLGLLLESKGWLYYRKAKLNSTCGNAFVEFHKVFV